MSNNSKAVISCDEWYPVFTLEEFTEWDEKWGHKSVQVDKDFLNDCERIETEFAELQDKLKELAKEAGVWAKE